MKLRLLYVLLLFLVGTNSFGQILDQDSVDFHEIEGASAEFNQYEDSLTLALYETGDVTVSWESVENPLDYSLISYKELNAEKWTQQRIESSNSVTINDLPQNSIFQFKLIAETKSGISHVSNTQYFNTFSKTVFENNSAKGKEEAAQFNWAISSLYLKDIMSVYPAASYTLKYNTKIGAKQHEANNEVAPWTELKDISLNTVSYQLKELTGGEKYVYKVGLNLGDQVIWSDKGKFETDRPWGLFKTLVLIGALGLFIFGMKIMSEGLQRAAGSRLRNMLASITSNSFKGLLTGFGITSVVQSSSVTTVMTVSFVNAGLMTLRQSVGVLMGANIGTTLTAWLILVFGFKVDISAYALILIAFGAPLLFFSKGSIKTWGSVIIGFALLFMGLGFLKENVPTLSVDSPLVQFFIEYKNSGLLGTLMFIGLGTLVTVVIQSSSAAMALTMALVGGGVLPFEVAAAMILGENIGTTITAQLAALIGNVHAKRAARIHALFNLIGVFWCIFVFHWFLKGIAMFMDADPFTDPMAANTGIAIFHSAFNIANVVLLIWFVPKLVSIAEKTVRSKGGQDEEFHLDYIGTGMMGTPDLSILEAKKEVAKFGQITSRMSQFTQELLTEQNKKKRNKLHEKIAKYEEITDRVEIEVANYLAKVSSGDMTTETAKRIRSMNSIVNDLERIGDIFYQMSKTIERKEEDKIYFLPEQRQSLKEIFGLVDNAFEVMIENLNADWNSENSIDAAVAAEKAINEKRDEMRTEHLINLGKKGFNVQSGMVFNNLFSSCEKVGDHIINVSEAITGNLE